MQSSSDEQAQKNATLSQSDSESYETLLGNARTENNAVLADINNLLKYEVEQPGRGRDKLSGISDEVAQVNQSLDPHFHLNNMLRGGRRSPDLKSRNRFKFQVIQQINKLKKRRREYRKK